VLQLQPLSAGASAHRRTCFAAMGGTIARDDHSF
jgi:hypothetical protein